MIVGFHKFSILTIDGSIWFNLGELKKNFEHEVLTAGSARTFKWGNISKFRGAGKRSCSERSKISSAISCPVERLKSYTFFRPPPSTPSLVVFGLVCYFLFSMCYRGCIDRFSSEVAMFHSQAKAFLHSVGKTSASQVDGTIKHARKGSKLDHKAWS